MKKSSVIRLALFVLTLAAFSACGEAVDPHTVQEAAAQKISVLDAAFEGYAQAEYDADDWSVLKGFYDDAVAAVNSLTEMDEIDRFETDDALEKMAAVPSKAKKLSQAKTAKNSAVDAELLKYKQSAYRPPDWNALTIIANSAKSAVNRLSTIDEVDAYDFSDSFSSMANIQTNAQRTAAEIAVAKETKISMIAALLLGYAEADYYPADWLALTTYASGRIDEITALATLSALNNYDVNAVLAHMRAVLNIEQHAYAAALLDEINRALQALQSDFDAQFMPEQYRAEDWDALQQLLSETEDEIRALKTIEEVAGFDSTEAFSRMSSVKTDAQRQEEEAVQTAADFIAMVNALTIEYSQSSHNALTEAQEAYAALTPLALAKAGVSDAHDKLLAAEILQQAVIDEFTTVEIDAFLYQVGILPAVESVIYNDKTYELITDANYEYTGLSRLAKLATQTKTAYAALQEVLAKYAAIKAKIDPFAQKVAALPGDSTISYSLSSGLLKNVDEYTEEYIGFSGNEQLSARAVSAYDKLLKLSARIDVIKTYNAIAPTRTSLTTFSNLTDATDDKQTISYNINGTGNNATSWNVWEIRVVDSGTGMIITTIRKQKGVYTSAEEIKHTLATLGFRGKNFTLQAVKIPDDTTYKSPYYNESAATLIPQTKLDWTVTAAYGALGFSSNNLIRFNAGTKSMELARGELANGVGVVSHEDFDHLEIKLYAGNMSNLIGVFKFTYRPGPSMALIEKGGAALEPPSTVLGSGSMNAGNPLNIYITLSNVITVLRSADPDYSTTKYYYFTAQAIAKQGARWQSSGVSDTAAIRVDN
jgi:hypothetical protein